MEAHSGFDEESVLALIGELHRANPQKRTFTLMEVADALWGPGSVTFAGTTVRDSHGEIVRPRRLMPRQMQVLNNVIEKLGHEDKLAVTTVAVIVFTHGESVGDLA